MTDKLSNLQRSFRFQNGQGNPRGDLLKKKSKVLKVAFLLVDSIVELLFTYFFLIESVLSLFFS